MDEDLNNRKPLADRMRPQTLDDFLGQDDIIGQGKLLRQAITNDKIPSMIFWGPPGTGKTTLALVIAKQTKCDFVRFSAVTSGLKDLREVIKKAQQDEWQGKKLILFIDEIHRWNKTQQDALLPHVERGLVTLIGATTENPSFEVLGALLSRCRVFVLKQLKPEQMVSILTRALKDKDNGLGSQKIKATAKILEMIAQMSNGDVRTALNVLEYASSLSVEITAEIVKEAFQKSYLLYDKNGDEHYNIISALHKAMRGSDADGALYWLARMLEAGEDPLYIARRVVRFASEDIGLANSRALEQAMAAYNACHFSKKSNELYTAYSKAKKDVEDLGNLPVPLHIRNAPTKLMKELGYGKDYQYSPDFNYQENQEYLPDKLKGKKYFNKS
ncbi:MAG: replication-associated recombination protein A [Candidatus Gribaldobacteria bacterium]|nr:replication-associated recombination protein A [Candidatus Gribaldobacteria bacterium]